TPRSPRSGALGVVVVAVLPREQGAELATGGLDGVLLFFGAELLELGRTGVLVVNEALGEGTGLYVGEDRLHVVLDVLVDDAGTRDVVTGLGGVRDGPALLGDAALPHEVDDELELVQHLEVGDLRLV